jgi:hypothetical protein
MKRILLVEVVLVLIFASCVTQKGNLIELENNGSIERMALLFQDNDEIIIKNIGGNYYP